MRLAGGLAVVLAAVALALALRASGSRHPGPFYAPPDPLPPGPPGTLIRSELIPGLYPGATAYRVLYKSSGLGGRPAAASGLIVIPNGPAPKRGRPVVAFAHGTVGVSRGCAPSLRRTGVGQVIEGLGQFIAAGDVVAASDYVGLGTPGPYPYLSGPVEARNTIDAVRAAHHLSQAHASLDFAVWGHSLGGQAALFTAQLASVYAPGLHLVGAAAGAPLADLPRLFTSGARGGGGKLLLAMALSAWARAFSAPGLLEVLAPASRSTAEGLAAECLYGSAAGGLSARAAGVELGAAPPWHAEPWRRILFEATPGGAPIHVPVLLVQGGADKVVPPRLTRALERSLCSLGEIVELRVYPTAEHAEAGTVASPDVAAWLSQRFAGAAAPSSCAAA